MKVDHNGYGNHMRGPPRPYAAAPYIPPVPSYQEYGGYDQGYHRIPEPRTDHYSGGYSQSSIPGVQPPYDSGYGQQYASTTSHPPNRRSHPQYERNTSGEHPMQLSNSPVVHQNGGPRYPNRPVPQDGYSGVQSYQSPAAGNFNQWGGANQSIPRGGYAHNQRRDYHQQHNSGQQRNYSHHQENYQQRGNQGYHQQRGNQGNYQHNNQQRINHADHQQNNQQRSNQFSALDRRSNKRPPPPGNGC